MFLPIQSNGSTVMFLIVILADSAHFNHIRLHTLCVHTVNKGKKLCVIDVDFTSTLTFSCLTFEAVLILKQRRYL